ncbi:placenta-specific gene 8 protein-like [Saccoglossus kowalevskii]|uniref:Cell number regulator 4-like n=1 Tax=Saccoglossus kowalevskii TaxID=10224 RepID=A0ABM0MSK3_SACKO|nr:PREDICTED: cell number regulator 4-like [Saccoglossus kowalevskii]
MAENKVYEQFGGGQIPPCQSQPPVGTVQMPITQEPTWQYQQPSTTTNVVIVQNNGRWWTTSLFGCFEDIGSCLAACFCLPCYRCYLSNKIGESCCLPLCICPPNDLVTMRMKLRTMKNIPGGAITDCCVSCWCPACAAAQMSREWDNSPRYDVT